MDNSINQVFKMTLFEAKGLMVKAFGVKDCKLIQERPGLIGNGKYQTRTTTLEQFGQGAGKLNRHQAVCLGTAENISGYIVTTEKHEELGSPADPIPRTKKHFQFHEQPTAMVLDIDGAQKITKEVVGILSEIIPDFSVSEKLIIASSSSGLYKDKKLLKNSTSAHVYVIVKNGTDIPRFIEVLFKRLWLAGFGHIEISKAGSMLIRSLIDATVGQPERIVYEAAPVLKDGITQDRTDPKYMPGEMLDTSRLLDLSKDEVKEYDLLVAAEKAGMKPESEKISKVYDNIQVEKLVERTGIPENVACAAIQARHHGILKPDDIICLTKEKTVQVKDLDKRYHGQTCCDPLEPSYNNYHNTVAKIFVNGNGSIVINSNAHGGCVYRVEAKAINYEALAELSPTEYDLVRTETAKEMGIRVATLDKEVKKLRQPEKNSDVGFEDIEAWPVAINGADLLDEIRAVVGSHLVMASNAIAVCALWVLLTYCFDAFRILPLLAVTSPEKRCGKTRLAEILHGLVLNPVLASNLSSAVLYRLVEKHRPCLLVDEADTFLVDNDELRGVFNSGHTRTAAFVWRVNPDSLDPERFSTWCPKAILMIGDMPDTLKDRSIPIRMKRKLTSENVTRISLDFHDLQIDIRRKCIRWVNDNIKSLIQDVSIPSVGNDRALDNWLPLISIADQASGEWPNLARSAMGDLEGDEFSDKDSVRQLLLADIRNIFDKTGSKTIASENLVEYLVRLKDHPWPEWRRGRPLTQSSLARLLKPFGIKPKNIRLSEKILKGYSLESLQDAFKRYLHPGHTPFQTATSLQGNNSNVLSHKQTATQGSNVAAKKKDNYLKLHPCSDVADETGVRPLQGIKNEEKGTSNDIRHEVTI